MHCSTHNLEYQCPACRAEQEVEYRRAMLDIQKEVKAELELEAERLRKELSELQKDQFDLLENLGRYDCPFCLYKNLKTGESQCPACHAEITQNQWHPIYKMERALAKARAKEEPERQRRAQETKQRLEAAEAMRNAELLDGARDWKMWLGIYFGYFLPILTVLSNVLISWFVYGQVGEADGVTRVLAFIVLLIPGASWLLVFRTFLLGQGLALELFLLLMWGVGGGIHAWITKPGSEIRETQPVPFRWKSVMVNSDRDPVRLNPNTARPAVKTDSALPKRRDA